MTDEQMRQAVTTSMDLVADAMSAFYDSDVDWFRKCVTVLTDDRAHADLAIQCLIQCVVRMGVQPSTFRLIPAQIVRVEGLE